MISWLISWADSSVPFLVTCIVFYPNLTPSSLKREIKRPNKSREQGKNTPITVHKNE